MTTDPEKTRVFCISKSGYNTCKSVRVLKEFTLDEENRGGSSGDEGRHRIG